MSEFDAITGAITLIKCTVEGEAADANSNVPTRLTFKCISQISNLGNQKGKVKNGFCKTRKIRQK